MIFSWVTTTDLFDQSEWIKCNRGVPIIKSKILPNPWRIILNPASKQSVTTAVCGRFEGACRLSHSRESAIFKTAKPETEPRRYDKFVIYPSKSHINEIEPVLPV
jgi:hypothetical protein